MRRKAALAALCVLAAACAGQGNQTDGALPDAALSADGAGLGAFEPSDQDPRGILPDLASVGSSVLDIRPDSLEQLRDWSSTALVGRIADIRPGPTVDLDNDLVPRAYSAHIDVTVEAVVGGRFEPLFNQRTDGRFVTVEVPLLATSEASATEELARMNERRTTSRYLWFLIFKQDSEGRSVEPGVYRLSNLSWGVWYEDNRDGTIKPLIGDRVPATVTFDGAEAPHQDDPLAAAVAGESFTGWIERSTRPVGAPETPPPTISPSVDASQMRPILPPTAG